MSQGSPPADHSTAATDNTPSGASIVEGGDPFRFRSPVSYALLMAALYLALFNARFWRETTALFWQGGLTDGLFLLAVAVLLLLAYAGGLLLIPGNRLLHVVSGVLVPLGAAAAFCADTFGIAIDEEMVRSLLAADRREAQALLTPRLALYAVGLGVLPMFLIGRIRLAPLSLYQHLRQRALFMTAVLIAAVLLALSFPERFARLSEQQHLRYFAVPGAALGGLARYAHASLAQPNYALIDSSPQRLPPAGAKPLLAFMVIGETARHASFQLGGYTRPTNPRLSQVAGLHYFGNVQACGTATAISLPCMLSPLGREQFSVEASRRVALLPDVLAGAGIDIEWRSNNFGSKNVGMRVPVVDFTGAAVPHLCNDESCLDDIMLGGLEQRLRQASTDTMIVFHQMGSHGPSYFKRYAPAAEVFEPACKTNELRRCSLEEIRNAYDNTIVHTDALLADMIALLERHAQRFDTMLLYVPDHGESLGENGVFLHGAPYAVAPPEQLRIPLIAWMSPGYIARSGIDSACLTARHTLALSHDHLYHTMLGALEVRDRRYRAELDLIAPCRGGR